MAAQTFDEWWNQDGELIASFAHGNISNFARSVWEAAIGSMEAHSASTNNRSAEIALAITRLVGVKDRLEDNKGYVGSVAALDAVIAQLRAVR
jgi:hypothetical protein